MDTILQRKIVELESANKYECWYLVKQETSFSSLCYQVSFLLKYQNGDSSVNLQEFIKNSVDKLDLDRPTAKVSATHRSLRVAAAFGLITMISSRYEDAKPTETFAEITLRCSGEYERTDLYVDIIQRQIEKVYVSSVIDEQHNTVRDRFNLFPIPLLYKVLVELGRSTGKYLISMNEYKYFVATTTHYENFLDTLFLIKLLREDVSSNTVLEKFKDKFDNRMIQAIKQLPCLIVTNESISLVETKVYEVSKKVFEFELNMPEYSGDKYAAFLGSKKSLFNVEPACSKSPDETVPDLSDDITNFIEGGMNTLIYGVPGSGKSWTIKNEYLTKGCVMERLVFHPDYTYADFIGQILPVVTVDLDNNKNVSYQFMPGPFTTLLKKSYENRTVEHFLIIEEINRGNAPAIFGEVFQLLDRKRVYSDVADDGHPLGMSEYEISNADIAMYVYGDIDKKVRIPSNMSIIGTMNTSDQNVYTLDSAFQRRWEMRLIENTFKESDNDLANTRILDTSVTWRLFCETINEMILNTNMRMTSSEDKRLGTHFVDVQDLLYQLGDDTRNVRRFADKVIKYLWDDAFKFSREDIFNVVEHNSLEKVLREFYSKNGNQRFSIFNEAITSIIIQETSIDE